MNIINHVIIAAASKGRPHKQSAWDLSQENIRRRIPSGTDPLSCSLPDCFNNVFIRCCEGIPLNTGIFQVKSHYSPVS